ncbi:MAG: nucleoside phosphorylase [Clostridiales bacterium]|nr:nucleoside phosphorylase [Clostridiales bacterium]
MMKREFPILEFDTDKNALINPDMKHQKMDIAENAVLCFFGDAIDKLKEELPFTVVYTLKFETYYYPVYEFQYHSERIVVVHMSVGAPIAAGIIDKLNALGCRKFIACGGCGVLVNDLPVGDLLIPVSAIRDEGTSYHYLEPSREVHANKHAIHCLENTLTSQGFRYTKVKTWTTDASFRETKEKIRFRKEEGCCTVEMEASAMMAVAEFRNVIFGQILYSGDDLSGTSWDKREQYSRESIREAVLTLAMDCCLAL